VSKGVLGSILCLLAALSLLFVGCGGGDDETTSSLTRAQFLKQGNAICKKSEEEKGKALRALVAKLDPNKPITKERKEQLVLTVILPPYEQTTEDLKGLGAPEGDEEEVEAIIKEMEKAAKKTKADPSVAVTTVREFEDANKMATDYGLTSCIV
jgi:hypothetical protein